MATGKKRATRQPPPTCVTTADLPTSPGHPFFDRLNWALEAVGFNAFAGGGVLHGPDAPAESAAGAVFPAAVAAVHRLLRKPPVGAGNRVARFGFAGPAGPTGYGPDQRAVEPLDGVPHVGSVTAGVGYLVRCLEGSHRCVEGLDRPTLIFRRIAPEDLEDPVVERMTHRFRQRQDNGRMLRGPRPRASPPARGLPRVVLPSHPIQNHPD